MRGRTTAGTLHLQAGCMRGPGPLHLPNMAKERSGEGGIGEAETNDPESKCLRRGKLFARAMAAAAALFNCETRERRGRRARTNESKKTSIWTISIRFERNGGGGAEFKLDRRKLSSLEDMLGKKCGPPSDGRTD